MRDVDHSQNPPSLITPFCALYAHKKETGRFLYVREDEPFPGQLGASDWRLILTGVEAPRGVASWLKTNKYHEVRGAWF